MNLTNTRIRNTKPLDKTQRLFDGGGLYLEVSPSGGKWWRYKYRYGGREKRISLGTYPDISLKDARQRHQEYRQLLANDVDPSGHKKAKQASIRSTAHNHFEAIGREWLDRQKENWSMSHATRVFRLFERDLFPWLGKSPITEIKPTDVLETCRKVEDRGAVETAHRTLSYCGQVFDYSVATGRIKANPCNGLGKALKKVQPGHFSAVTDPKEVGPMLRTLDGYEGSPIVKTALKLAPLVFVRPGELRSAKWADIDLESAEWRFEASKTKVQHIVPLSRQAVKTFSELQPITGHGKYVFPSARSKDRPMSDNAVLAAFRRLEIPKDKMTGHGFRAMARTILDEVLGFRPDYIEHQLAHAVRDPHGRAYNRTAHLPERKKMMQQWADYLDELKNYKG